MPAMVMAVNRAMLVDPIPVFLAALSELALGKVLHWKMVQKNQCLQLPQRTRPLQAILLQEALQLPIQVCHDYLLVF